MRSLEQIHLDELESLEGLAMNLHVGYARRLAQVASNKYDRMFVLLEDTELREVSMARFIVSTKDRIQHALIECFQPRDDVDAQGLRLGYGSMKTPSESVVQWNPQTDIPVGNRPRSFRPGDRINYLLVEESFWDGAEVIEPAGRDLPSEIRAIAPNGMEGLFNESDIELVPPVKIGEVNVSGQPAEDIMQGADGKCFAQPSRSTGYVLVGTYELVLSDVRPEGAPKWRRLNYTSFPIDVREDSALMEQAGDALNTIACLEYGLDQAQVFTMFDADKFEAENEGRIV